MEHNDLLKLDLGQIARARARARRKNPSAGLDYLHDRVRRELGERWALESPGDGAPERVLLLDFDDARPDLGEAVTIRRVSPLESADACGRPPFADDAGNANDGDDLDGVVIGLQMAWLDLEATFAQALRALRPGGRLLFCTFGPDTLAQLRRAWGEVDDFPHVHPFLDMHLVGDQLLRSGFARPIVDVDRVTVEYQHAGILYDDLRGEGFINVLGERRKTLTGKARFKEFSAALEARREPGTPLAVTYELIYGAATAPSPSSSPIRVAPPQMT